MTEIKAQKEARQDTGLGCIIRLFWLLIGNVLLIVTARYIWKHEVGFLSVADAFYWAIVIILVIIRYIDVTKMGGLTAFGQPASLANWRRYVVFLFIGSATLWAAAHALAML